MNLNFELIIPNVPDVVHYRKPPVSRGEGFKANNDIPLKELTEQQVNEYAEEVKQSIIGEWNRLRK